MVNGRWLMRCDLLTLDERQLILEARSYAKEIDAFLIKRERSVLSKLIAIGGAMEEESFEVQSKVRINNPDAIIKALEKEAIDVEYTRHYREYDTYFFFEDESEGRLRYREDEFINREGKVTQVRSRLTLVGVSSEDTFDMMLSCPAVAIMPCHHSLRFYREYFAPVREIDIEKIDSLQNQYKDDFYINIDTLINPDLGHFLEVKSRTWGREDAIRKSNTIQELIEYLGASSEMAETQDYIEIVQAYFSSR